jgi:two-component system, LytTR family, sensor histidine kinase AlgZ
MTTDNDSKRVSFLPDLCGVRALFGVVVIGELLAIVLTLVGGGIAAPALERLSLISLFTQWIGLSAAAVLCLSRRWLERLPETLAALVSYLMILIVVYVISELAWWVINPIAGIEPVIDLERADFLVRSLGISAIVGALVLRYFYVQHHWKQRIVSEAQARLEALQARIRPHFLFNCMNTIASLTRSDPRAAERAVEDLADLFRASMGENRSLVTFDEEIELVRGYLNIEALRLGPRLKTEWQIEGLPSSGRIPPLTLQPLVENAIYHGIEPLRTGGVIEISGACDDRCVRISIVNPVTSATSPHHRGNRLAQENVKQRLIAHFGERGGLEIDAKDDRYRVTVTVPMERDDAHRDR